MNKILWKSIREETKLITNYTENNYLVLIGKIISDKTFSHEIYGESFYVFNLEVPRLSGNEDIIPITISERLQYLLKILLITKKSKKKMFQMRLF